MGRELKCNENMVQYRAGECRINTRGEEMVIVRYAHCDDITVEFTKTGEQVICKYRDFKKGNVKSHFAPSVYGVGVVGLESIVDNEGEILRSYRCWRSMIQRCYSERVHEQYPNYRDCSVSKEWLTYGVFKKWYNENYYELSELGVTTLDKDILVKGNKLYSAKTCVFVPNSINVLFTKRRAMRGELPIGVTRDVRGRIRAKCAIPGGKEKFLGYFDTPEEAFQAYKSFKEQLIRSIAEEYKPRIPQKLYNGMVSYRVEITD